MPLLDLRKAPRLDQVQNFATWAREITDYLDRRTGQLVLPFGMLMASDAAINEDLPLPGATLIGIEGPAAGFFIGGLAGGMLGRYVILLNFSGQTMVMLEADTNSQDVNRIFNYGAGNFTANVVQLVHTGNTGSWVVLSHS